MRNAIKESTEMQRPAVLYDYRSDGFRAVSRYYFSRWNYINDFLVEIASCSLAKYAEKSGAMLSPLGRRSFVR